ncbi:MAG: CopD family protein [Cytophagaceae bacterium]|nr:CopD family protein [Cytophagaceae bacterium]MDW8455611.1 CopD family protein [Cytophagaceae bacterium]
MLYLKSLHIIFIVTWFAGLFYIVRLFIYHREALDKPDSEKNVLIAQFLIMEKRLWYGITWPSMVLASASGYTLMFITKFYSFYWMHIKLILVILLTLYHIWIEIVFQKMKKGTCSYSSYQLRLMNELATLFLVTIVFIIVCKNQLNYFIFFISLLLFAAAMVMFIRIYKRIRTKT